MAIFLKKFETMSQYNAYTADTENFILPNVSLITENNNVEYNPSTPPTPSFFCKLTNYRGEIDIVGSGELTEEMINNVVDEKIEIESAEIGTLCTSIGYMAFSYSNNLTSITISDSVTTIGGSAFENCYSLTSVTIPSGVTTIGDNALGMCTGLTSITVEAVTPPTLSDYEQPFDTDNNCPIYVPSGSVNAYKAASGWSAYASRIQAIP